MAQRKGTHRAERPNRLEGAEDEAPRGIVQEAVRNVARHSEADSASIRVSFGRGALRVEVADDGRGFSPPEPLSDLISEGRLGLVGMRERARLVGGTLAVRSRPGQGTVIVIEVDLPSGAFDEDAPADGLPRP